MQNWRIWTVVSNFIKLRGLGEKNKTLLEFLLDRLGPWVDFKEMEGLFSKSASRRGIFRSDPLDRDLRARVRLDLDLILRVHLGSHG